MSKDPSAKPEPVKEAQSWDDKLADALPQKASFFNAMRTNPFTNLNAIANYIEFWSAFQVDAKEDRWTVMHYMAHDLDEEDGSFIAEPVAKQVSFAEAVYHLSRLEFASSKMLTHLDFKMEERYPLQKYPELKNHYYDLEHYKKAANIEGIAFDEFNKPYRKVQGKIFSDATFKRSEVSKSILSVDQARDNDKVRERIEGGLLADVFNTAVNPVASLDDKLKIGQVLSIMDNFAVLMASYYLAVQQLLNIDEKLDKVSGLSPDDRADLIKRAQSAASCGSPTIVYGMITRDILPQANNLLKQAQALGVHTEPFAKHAAECELFINLVNAAQNVAKMDRALINANNTDIGLITQVRESVDRAQSRFLDLGGTQEQMDKLKAWISAFAREESDPVRQKEINQKMVPAWLPGFLNRYYEKRAGIMQKVQKRTAGIRQVNIMAVDVKPPVTDAYNSNAETELKPKQETPAQGAATADLDKYKTMDGTSPNKSTQPKL